MTGMMRLFSIAALALFLIGAKPSGDTAWPQVLDQARGQTVEWYMYGGFPAANSYVNGYVAPRVKELYGIELRQVPVTDISEIVGKLLIEKQAGKTGSGDVDLMWINGENFRTARKHGLLYGPFAQRLPNQKLVDWDQATVKLDFGEPVEGMESPWGSAQFVIVYDTKRTPDPPRTMGDFLEWIREHPGRFTYPAPPDFTGSVFVRHVFYHLSGDAMQWAGEFDEGRFNDSAKTCYQTLRELAPFLWRKGSTYPESPVRLAHMFADGEVDFAMSYHPAEASKMISDGLYPDTVRTLVFEEGTIANTHFVAIPVNARDKEGAMVVADFLLSPEAQLKKASPEVWGDLPAVDSTRLDEAWKKKFMEQPRGPATLADTQLRAHQLPELPSSLLVRLEKGWDEHVLKGRP